MKVSGGSSVESAGDPDADTIELELTPEHMLALTRADHIRVNASRDTYSVSAAPRASGLPVVARQADAPVRAPAALAFKPAVPQRRQQSPHQTAWLRRARWPLVLTASILAIVAIVWTTATRRAPEQPPARAPVVVRVPPASAPLAAVPAEPAPPPVRFTNPFDRSEVFEFPSGTSLAEARQLAAQLLARRAQERLESRRARAVRHVRRAPNETAGVEHPPSRYHVSE